jgi:uncharacterized membrane protein
MAPGGAATLTPELPMHPTDEPGPDRLTTAQQRILEHLVRGRHVSRDINREFRDARTFGQRLADRIAAFGGSWTFIGLFLTALLAWVVLNIGLRARAFDPYPYILLNLFLSMLASLQAPIIMMSQNRQAAKDRLDAEHDYEVNLKAEIEIRTLHEKMDQLRDREWGALVALQNEQIRMLERLLDQSGR